MLTIVVLPHLKDKRFADETLLLQGIFEVMRSDGTCQPITEDTVRELKELVPTFFFFSPCESIADPLRVRYSPFAGPSEESTA